LPARSVSYMPSHLHLASSPGRTAQASNSGDIAPAPEAPPIKVLLADGHALVLRGLRRLLDGEQDMEVIAEVDDLARLSSDLREHRPHVLVLDLDMAEESSIDVLGRLRECAPDTQIVILTMEETPTFALRALTMGATGYVMTNLADSELPKAVRAAVRGEQYVSPSVAGRLQALHRSLTANALTPREVDVLRLIALGHTSVEIARKLRLSPRTVETHRAHVHRKLGLATRAQLVRYALLRGLLGTK
jgi:two-component system, NarL family, response regulator NreC